MAPLTRLIIEPVVSGPGTHSTAVAPPDSARTLVLSNTDILSTIFEHFCAQTDRAFLYGAVLTCKAFKALDCLWETLPSLFPLLQLLPSFRLRNGYWVSGFTLVY